MNKMVKTAALIAFVAVFFVFDVKPAAALDLKGTIGKVANDATKSAEKSAANNVQKVINNSVDAKGPLKTVQITEIPAEYSDFFAQLMATIPDEPTNACLPAYLTPAYITTTGKPLIDSVASGEVKVYTPCDDKKRLLVLTLSKTKNETSNATVFLYAKDADGDVCKSKATMPIYKLSETQVFRFSDFILNDDCKKKADAITKTKK